MRCCMCWSCPEKPALVNRTVHDQRPCSGGGLLFFFVVITGIRIILLVLLHFLLVLLLQFCRLFVKWCLRSVGQGLPLLSSFFGHLSYATLANLLLNRCAILAQPEPISTLWLLWLVWIPVGLPRPLVCFLSLRLRLVRAPLARHASCRHEGSHVFLKLCLSIYCLLLVGPLLSCRHLFPLLARILADDRSCGAACLFRDGLPVLAQEKPVGVLGLPWLLHDGHVVSIGTPRGWTSAQQGLRCL